MQNVDTALDFAMCARDEPVWARVPIDSVADYVNALADDIKGRGIQADRVVSILEQNLRGICTSCCCRIPYSVIGDVWLTTTFGRERVIFTKYGPVSRMLDGLCPNKDCPSKELRLIWDYSEYFLSLLQEHVNRLLTDAGLSKQTLGKQCLERLIQPPVLGFVTDSLWSLTLTSIEQNLMTLDVRDSFQDLCVWVTTVGCLPEQAKTVFPLGYIRTFEAHLRDVGYKQSDFDFVHCIFTFHAKDPDQIQGIVHLAAISRVGLMKSDDRFLITPVELLMEKEERELGGHPT